MRALAAAPSQVVIFCGLVKLRIGPTVATTVPGGTTLAEGLLFEPCRVLMPFNTRPDCSPMSPTAEFRRSVDGKVSKETTFGLLVMCVRGLTFGRTRDHLMRS
jgi:hypothetical protein